MTKEELIAKYEMRVADLRAERETLRDSTDAAFWRLDELSMFLDDLRGLELPAPPAWTTERPTVPGRYLRRDDQGGRDYMANFDGKELADSRIYCGGQWYGPIPGPDRS